MKRVFVSLLVLFVASHSANSANQIDVFAVVPKADAERALGETVRAPDHRNKGGKEGFYESECTYESGQSDKMMMLDLVTAPINVVHAMLSAASTLDKNPVTVSELGDRAVFYQNSGMFLLNILKGNTFVAVGIHGLPPQAALEQEKIIAKKILAKL